MSRAVMQQALEALESDPVTHAGLVDRKQAITALRAALAEPERKPLTDGEIETYRYMIDWTASWSYINFARAIERAHGIGGDE